MIFFVVSFEVFLISEGFLRRVFMKRVVIFVLCLAAYIFIVVMVKFIVWINGKFDKCYCIFIASKKVESEYCLLIDIVREYNISLLLFCYGL